MKLRHYLLASVVAMFSVVKAHTQGTAFAYQGQLRDGGTNANGSYTMIFKLYDAVSGGSQVGNAITNNTTLVNGIFSVSLDFGSTVFDGGSRWLDTTVIKGATTETLSPRAQLLPTPYSIYAANAGQLASGGWNVRTGDFEGFTNVFQIYDGDFFVMGMISNGVLVNGDLNSSKFSTGHIFADDMDLAEGGSIFFSSSTNGVQLSSDGSMGLDISGPLSIGNKLTFNDGSSLLSGGQGSLLTSGDLTTSNLTLYGSTIRFPDRAGATMIVQTNGDFVFDGNLKISAQGILKIPTENSTPVSLSAYGQGGQTLVVDARIQPNSINLPAGSGFVLIDADNNNSVVLHGKLSIPAGDITIGGGITASGNISANSFTTTSDRNVKENFSPVDPREVLDRVASLPISRWNFKTDSNTRHIGPMAQDFYQTFGVGMDDKHIATVDEEGVALAAIQGLNEKLKEKDAQIQSLETRLAELEKIVRTEGKTTTDAK